MRRKLGNDTVISGRQGQLSHGKIVWQRLFAFSPDRTLSPLTWESGISKNAKVARERGPSRAARSKTVREYNFEPRDYRDHMYTLLSFLSHQCPG